MSEPKFAGWYTVGNSWQYTTVYDVDGTPICQFDLEDWGVTEENQDRLEQVQVEFANRVAAGPDMYAALKYLNELIAEGAAHGFNPTEGDWGKRLFLSQQKTSAALARARGEQS